MMKNMAQIVKVLLVNATEASRSQKEFKKNGQIFWLQKLAETRILMIFRVFSVYVMLVIKVAQNLLNLGCAPLSAQLLEWEKSGVKLDQSPLENLVPHMDMH